MVSADDLDAIQEREPSHYFNREYLAEWTDATGAYFTTAEIDDATAPYDLIDPIQTRGQYAVGGIDWGMTDDANAVVHLSALGDTELNEQRRRDMPVLYVSALEQQFGMPYSTFIDRLTTHAQHLHVAKFISETDGVWQMPTQVLRDRVSNLGADAYWAPVVGRATDARRKVGGFGRIKVLLQQGRLVLPKHPDLLKQLHHLTYEQTEGGNYKISVPENIGHDDLAMALMRAATTSPPAGRVDSYTDGGSGDILTTGTGTRIPRRPSTTEGMGVFANGGKNV